MAKVPRSFDIWFVAANTVYKKVPFLVAADWVLGGRLSAADRVRPAGTETPWLNVGSHELFSSYLPAPETPAVAATSGDSGNVAAPLEEIEPAEPRPRRRRQDDDDDPDMIPLIDISLVLLIFFMMIRASGALSPVDVPDMQFAGELSKNADVLTIAIERRSADDVYYSVRKGENAAPKEHTNLPTPEAAIAALDQFLRAAQQPPDVRIACAKELPNERVYEIVRELKSRKARNLINSFDAEVNEKSPK